MGNSESQMKRFRRRCNAILVMMLGVSPFALTQTGSVRGVHDPAVIRSGESFYIFSTGRGIPMRRSDDLFNWQSTGTVFADDMPAWAKTEIPGARGLWAPDISFHAGKFWLYYSVSTFGSQRSAIGLAVNMTLDPASPDYRWVDRGMVIDSAPGKCDFNAIDPAAFTDRQGRRWLAWGSFWSGIKMTRLDPQTGKRISPDSRIFPVARRPQATAVEAPYVVFHDGYYYLFVSFDQCCKGVKSTYKMMVGRGREPTGPYLDASGRDMMEGGGTLVLDGGERWKGPGHNSFLQLPGGDYLVHHAYDAQNNGVAALQIRPITWEAGWPKPGEPISTGVSLTAAGRGERITDWTIGVKRMYLCMGSRVIVGGLVVP